jgi:hypothetical protein
MEKNPNLKEKALADAVEKQNWDPSIPAMGAFPDVVNRLTRQYHMDVGSGKRFLAQAHLPISPPWQIDFSTLDFRFGIARNPPSD